MQSVCCLHCPEGEGRTLNTKNTLETSVISGAKVRRDCTDDDENMVKYALGNASVSSES